MKKLVLASNNAGKLREFSQLLALRGLELVPQTSLGVPDADEPHVTFVENALAKARHASRITGLPALADDSGLCVSALNDEPGVYSARYSAMNGGKKSDADNNALLVSRLQGHENRAGRYVAVLVLVRSENDPQPLIGEGVLHGLVTDTPRGENGFGYDPYFFLPELGRTVAELNPEQKNAISHRGKALARLLDKLDALDR
nr:RdgB/HAM1 family non-canonical purine NTP pyrophosphatase [Pseudomonas sp.]